MNVDENGEWFLAFLAQSAFNWGVSMLDNMINNDMSFKDDLKYSTISGSVNISQNGVSNNYLDKQEINSGVNSASQSLSSQLASLDMPSSKYRSFGRLLIPHIYADPTICNGVIDGNEAYIDYVSDLNIMGHVIPKYNGSQHRLKAYEANSWGKFRNSGGMVSRIAYGIADDVWLTTQRMIFQRLPSKMSHLDNSGVISSEIVGAGINTFTNFIPVSNIGRTIGIAKVPINAAIYNSLYKGTGVYASRSGGSFIRQYNNVIRHNVGTQKAWNYVGLGGLAFCEETSRKRNNNAAHNYPILLKIALNLLRNEKLETQAVTGKRLKATWNEAYLLKLLNIKV